MQRGEVMDKKKFLVELANFECANGADVTRDRLNRLAESDELAGMNEEELADAVFAIYNAYAEMLWAYIPPDVSPYGKR